MCEFYKVMGSIALLHVKTYLLGTTYNVSTVNVIFVLSLTAVTKLVGMALARDFKLRM